MLRKEDLRIGVFRGGVAVEREVSLESGLAVRDALVRKGYDVVDCVIDSAQKEHIANIIKTNNINFVFIVIHGEFGEDGQLQSILDELGVRYTGSGPKASENAMDKIKTHEILEDHDIVMPAYKVINSIEDVRKVKLPCVVKAHCAGSSIGVFLVNTEEELKKALDQALEISCKVLVEEFIQGREFTIGIMNDEVLPVVEISPKADFYDYQSKYVADDTGFIVPAQLDENITKMLQTIALSTYNALGCSGAARVDILLDSRAQAYVLELNSIPGMTSHSLLPLAAAKTGLSFDDLCARIVQLTFY